MTPRAMSLECFDRSAGLVIHDVPDEIAAMEEAARLAEEEEARRIAEEKARHEARLTAIAESLAALADNANRARDAAFGALAGPVAGFLRTAAPSLIDTAFAEETARRVLEIVRDGALAVPVIRAAPQDHDDIVAAIAGRAPGTEITIVGDPAQRPGTLALEWQDGGAEFDRDTMARALSEMVETRLAQIKRSQSTDE